MQIDFSPFFTKYEAILAEVDKLFAKISAEHPDEVTCHQGCSDCCHAMFDLTLVEALYINHHFLQAYKGTAKDAILDRADDADREAYRHKKRLFKASQEGVRAADLLEEVARMRVRCPLLNNDDTCALYDHRPLTCRLYGVPLAIGGEAHTCGQSGFEPGGKYPTINVEKLQDALIALSQEIVANLPTTHTKMGELLVPLSMALLTKYDNEYLGIIEDCQACGGGHEWVLGDEPGEESACGPTACGSCAQSSFCAAAGKIGGETS